MVPRARHLAATVLAGTARKYATCKCISCIYWVQFCPRKSNFLCKVRMGVHAIFLKVRLVGAWPGTGPGTRDQGPGTRDQDQGPGTRDQGPGPGTRDRKTWGHKTHPMYVTLFGFHAQVSLRVFFVCAEIHSLHTEDFVMCTKDIPFV